MGNGRFLAPIRDGGKIVDILQKPIVVCYRKNHRRLVTGFVCHVLECCSHLATIQHVSPRVEAVASRADCVGFEFPQGGGRKLPAWVPLRVPSFHHWLYATRLFFALLMLFFLSGTAMEKTAIFGAAQLPQRGQPYTQMEFSFTRGASVPTQSLQA